MVGHSKLGISSRVLLLLCSSGLACLPACDSSPSPDVHPPTIFDTPRATVEHKSRALEHASDRDHHATPESQQSSGLPSTLGVRSWVPELPWEANYAQYANGQRIGYSIIHVSRSALNVSGRLKIVRRDFVDAAVMGEKMPTEFELEALESSTGQLHRFSLKANLASGAVLTEGIVQEHALKLITRRGDQQTQNSLDYPDNTWGVLGVQAMLMQQPMQAGEKRTGMIFIAGLNIVAQVELMADQWGPTPVAGGATPDLLPIEVTMRAEALNIESRNWIDARGEIQKTLTRSNPSILTLRIDQATRLRFEAEREYAQLQFKIIECTGDVGSLSRLESAVYTIEAAGVDPFSLLSQTDRQRVRSIGPRSSEVTVFSPASSLSVGSDAEDHPKAAHLAASSLVPSEHELIDRLASQICEGLSESTNLADALNAAVCARIQPAAFSGQLVGALQTARKLEGDGPARAILLMALLRNRGIPARLASGLHIEAVPVQAARFQTWVEAWNVNGWISLDPNTGTRADVGYIQMHVSSLTEDNPYLAVLPALEHMQSIRQVQVVQPP